jgi:hypothetical protein
MSSNLERAKFIQDRSIKWIMKKFEVGHKESKEAKHEMAGECREWFTRAENEEVETNVK